MNSANDQNLIAVIGAGVIGLQTAVSLLEHGYAVIIIAKHLPGDLTIEYTSPWAGADWRTQASPEEPEIRAWEIETYNKWFEMIEKEKGESDPAKKSGIAQFTYQGYWTFQHPEISAGPANIWCAPQMHNFKVLPTTSLAPDIIAGVSHDCISIDTAKYLQYLADRVRSLGGVILRAPLPTSSGLSGALLTAERIIRSNSVTRPVNAFVNATGIGARDLVPDPAVYPIRGQTVSVRGTAHQISTVVRADVGSYVIPRGRSGITILGGTRQPDNWNPDPEPETTKLILESCKKLAPELLNEKGEFEVLRVNVGRRPGRRGGPRVEVEEVGTEEGRRIVVHEYGHAGAGYQNSFGSAGKVVRLLDEYFAEQRASAKL
ncbi:nucleotide-binding domain-containing protein [Saccharata proteae CBS 121410]|uniref:Nucleotide-binding domain-containing protein n=1 Tax=Saccharata proteae CBS 121410 TaxID=1314787 RepID=A0A9P4LYZ6_9PEZI|nr:nucleotide-binding domain-containing protein [Saccharata proteae CBS 121410]